MASNLIPRPNGWADLKNERCIIPATICIDFGSFEPWCVRAFCERSGRKMTPSAPGQGWFLRLIKKADRPTEGYRLTVAEGGAVIEASSENGIIWALTTFYSLIEPDGTAPACDIEDSPKLKHRGLMVDCARHFFNAEQIKQVIEQISLVKMNVLHWHLSDDQGWRIESKRFPLLHEISEQYYTQAEIQDVVEFAQLRGVEIIPEIDMPGHTIAILAAYPAFGCRGQPVQLAKCGGIYRTILCPGKEKTFSLIEQLLDEICPLFPSPRFHTGGDEAPKNEWAVCPDCQCRMREEHLSSLEDLQGYFTIRVSEMLKKHGKQPVCWNDSLLADNLPTDTIIQYWTLQHARSMQKFADQGGSFIFSDMFELYLDYPCSMSPVKKVYHCRPRIENRDYSRAEGMLGLEACLWTEHVQEGRQLEALLFPRVFALAEAAWTQQPDYKGFLRRLPGIIDRTLQMGVNCTSFETCNPRGKARRSETISFLSAMNTEMPPEVRKITLESASPGPAFVRQFITRFFHLGDLPFIITHLLRKNKRGVR